MTSITIAGQESGYQPGRVTITQVQDRPFPMPPQHEMDRLFSDARGRLPALLAGSVDMSPETIEHRLREDFDRAYRGLAYLKRTGQVNRRLHAGDWAAELQGWFLGRGERCPLLWAASVVLAAVAWGDIAMAIDDDPRNTFMALDRRDGISPSWRR